MESKTPPVTAFSRVDAEDQVDQTQSTGFEVSVPNQNKGKTSSKVEPDTQTLLLTTTDDVQALLLSNDDLVEESDDVFEAGDEMDEDIQQGDKEKPSKESATKEKHEEVAASYADLKWSLKDFIHTSFTKYENNDTALRNFQQPLNLFKADHNTTLQGILANLKEVQDAVKEDFALNKKGEKADMDTEEADEKEPIKERVVENVVQEPKADIDTEEADEKEPIKEHEVENVVQEPKLVKASSKVCLDPDEPVRFPYEIHKKLCHLTNYDIQDHLDKEEKIKKASEKANLLAMSKHELIKDVELKVLNREHSKKIKRSRELRKKRIKKYRWTTSNRLKPKTMTDVKIHPNTKPIAMIVFRGLDKRNFDVHNPFTFGDFGVTEWDELREIIPKKKNQVVKDMMKSLSKRYEILRTTPDELRISSSLSAPVKSLPEGVPFVNNMVIEEPEYVMFFIDVFGDHAFQRMNDIHKVYIKTLLTYLVMASNITTHENTTFYLKLRKLIEKHPDQEKLKSKKVKLEYVRYKLD
ncbi:hypothetical protein Tco_1083943 [Tanacetum coccineum]